LSHQGLLTILIQRARDLEGVANHSSAQLIQNSMAEISDRWNQLQSSVDDKRVGFVASFYYMLSFLSEAALFSTCKSTIFVSEVQKQRSFLSFPCFCSTFLFLYLIFWDFNERATLLVIL